MSEQQTHIDQALAKIVKQYKAVRLLRALLSLLPLLLLLLAFGSYYLNLPALTLGIISLVLLLTRLLLTSKSPAFQAITPANLLLHYNRHYPELQESAQLVLQTPAQLNVLQSMQRDKIMPRVAALLSQQRFLWHSLHLNKYISLSIMSLLIILAGINLSLQSDNSASPQQVSAEAKQVLPPTLASIQVQITPPPYTQLASETGSKLSLQVVAGAKVEWLLQFEEQNTSNVYLLQLSDGQQIEFEYLSNHTYRADAIFTQSTVYSIIGPEGQIGELNTVAVAADLAPIIRFIKPVLTTTEFAKDTSPVLDVEVVVNDDYAITAVDIVASIAKGSGEAVKFRDQQFHFDQQQLIEGKSHYFKKWTLSELDMAPGDEMYFTIIATDNRQPQPQQTRSPSKIVRWLEEEQNELASEGLLQSVLPAYFKSQRQIIIETEQLIAEKPLLSDDQFKQTSQSLGQAQSDLKQKYGEFLGDEFEGATLHSMESGPVIEHAHEDEQDHDDADKHDEQTNKPEQHAHGHEEASSETNNQDAYGQLIAQYGHNHGEADLGYIGKPEQPSPVALMKRSIANMWDAERHLLQAAPELALPFEKEALRYLNRAKQAERIYVKRLGFEPPPVSEARRYQGKLNDIVARSQNKDLATLIQANTLIEDALRALNTWLFSADTATQLTLNSEQFASLKQLFLDEASQNTDAISFVATLEQLQLNADKLKLQCRRCIVALSQQLWQRLPAPVASPSTLKKAYLNSNSAVSNYQQFLQQEP
ncbi:MAG: hypothetical protein NWQ54_00540 [Paraglaciecola sp.]|nr:hypothetical protein [Paraglaciecola sp.]